MQQPGADQSHLLVDEADAGLDGICAAAFALKALSQELSELRTIPEATLTGWREAESRPKAKKVILEVLAQTFDTEVCTSPGRVNWRGCSTCAIAPSTTRGPWRLRSLTRSG
jgi:hypothetical protein